MTDQGGPDLSSAERESRPVSSRQHRKQLVCWLALCVFLAAPVVLLVVSTLEQGRSRESQRQLAEIQQRVAGHESILMQAAIKTFPLGWGRCLHEFGRPCEWKAQHRPLGSSRFQASIGPQYYQDSPSPEPSFFSIDVEEQRGDVWYVLAQKGFLPSELPRGFLARSLDEVVTFLEDTRTAVFTIGDEQLRYDLPSADG